MHIKKCYYFKLYLVSAMFVNHYIDIGHKFQARSDLYLSDQLNYGNICLNYLKGGYKHANENNSEL